MYRRLGWLVCLTLAFPTAALGGDKVVTVGKAAEFKGEVKEDDPKVNVNVLGMTAAMPSKMFSLKLEAGKNYRIAMDAGPGTDLDPFLVVQDKDGKQLAFDDDSGGGTNALLRFTPPATGVYKVFAASLAGSGPFTLKVTAEEAAKFKLRRLKVGAEVTRVNEALKAGVPRITFEVELEAGKSYQIDLMSKAFDAFLVLQDDSGNQLDFNDDFGDSNDSRIVHRAARSGIYRIVATSLSMRETGDFVLEIRQEK